MRILWAVLIVGGCGALGPAAPPRDPAVVAAERACTPVVNADPAVRAYDSSAGSMTMSSDSPSA